MLPPILRAPDEILEQVVDLLDKQSLKQLRLVATAIREVASQGLFSHLDLSNNAHSSRYKGTGSDSRASVLKYVTNVELAVEAPSATPDRRIGHQWVEHEATVTTLLPLLPNLRKIVLSISMNCESPEDDIDPETVEQYFHLLEAIRRPGNAATPLRLDIVFNPEGLVCSNSAQIAAETLRLLDDRADISNLELSGFVSPEANINDDLDRAIANLPITSLSLWRCQFKPTTLDAISYPSLRCLNIDVPFIGADGSLNSDGLRSFLSKVAGQLQELTIDGVLKPPLVDDWATWQVSMPNLYLLDLSDSLHWMLPKIDMPKVQRILYKRPVFGEAEEANESSGMSFTLALAEAINSGELPSARRIEYVGRVTDGFDGFVDPWPQLEAACTAAGIQLSLKLHVDSLSTEEEVVLETCARSTENFTVEFQGGDSSAIPDYGVVLPRLTDLQMMINAGYMMRLVAPYNTSHVRSVNFLGTLDAPQVCRLDVEWQEADPERVAAFIALLEAGSLPNLQTIQGRISFPAAGIKSDLSALKAKLEAVCAARRIYGDCTWE